MIVSGQGLDVPHLVRRLARRAFELRRLGHGGFIAWQLVKGPSAGEALRPVGGFVHPWGRYVGLTTAALLRSYVASLAFWFRKEYPPKENSAEIAVLGWGPRSPPPLSRRIAPESGLSISRRDAVRGPFSVVRKPTPFPCCAFGGTAIRSRSLQCCAPLPRLPLFDGAFLARAAGALFDSKGTVRLLWRCLRRDGLPRRGTPAPTFAPSRQRPSHHLR